MSLGTGWLQTMFLHALYFVTLHTGGESPRGPVPCRMFQSAIIVGTAGEKKMGDRSVGLHGAESVELGTVSG